MNKQFSGVICVACVVIIVFCMARAIPYGLAGNVASAKPYFILMAIACVIGLPFAVLYEFRTKQEKDTELERMRIEMNTLSQTAQNSGELKKNPSASTDNAVVRKDISTK